MNKKWLHLTFTMAAMAAGAPRHAADAEPDIETARQWWPAQRNVWTPVGWKDHYFRFNVVYDGTIIAEPCPHWTTPRPNARRWLGQSCQLNFTPSPDDEPPPLPGEPVRRWRIDGGLGNQGWRDDHPTPVLWTEWRLQEGLVIRQEVFAHVRGGQDVESGIEPIYAWIRLSVTHVDPLRAVDLMPVAIQLSKVYYFHNSPYLFEDGVTIDADPELAPYPQVLAAEGFDHDGMVGLRLSEPDGKIRLVVLPTDQGRVRFTEPEVGPKVYALSIDMHAQVGDHVDLLLPMLPQSREEIDVEQALGLEGALAESDAFWSETPATAARIQVPEEFVNRAIAQNLKFAGVIAEKDYKTGDRTFLSGSWGYDNLWSTPTSMTSHMFLDLAGYHDTVAEHVELFRRYQGDNTPPGPAYDPHPGYFGTPRTLTAIDWLSDHGAILHQVSKHALLTDDAGFVNRWTAPIVAACEFIKDASASKDHQGVPGLLPPAVATDESFPTQAIWNLGWNYKGLTTAVRLLQRIGHPRAPEFSDFADGYQQRFIDAFRERSKEAPRWTDSSGREHPKPPTTLSTGPAVHHVFTDAFYLDTGPLFLVWAGLLPADDPLMQSTLKFFREGPNHQLYGVRSNPLARPVLQHEISSCEPCYSWNVFHSWQLGDRKNFLTGLYSLLTGAISPQTFISCEHRHGVYGNLFAFPLAFELARLSVIDDEIVPGEVHLLRMCPLAWCSEDQETVFERMPTEFGPVDLRFKLSPDAQTLDVSFDPAWRHQPKRVVLHPPPIPGLRAVIVNGERHQIDGEMVIIPR
ncbi:MAG: hypothetical protein ACR2GI_02255 [Thermomicrobiales bacterium]